jgi:hypothetical protein
MHRQPLDDIRDHIETLATESGDYYLVCARYGDRPVPAQGLRFTDRPTARAAARATEQYRAALRRYDPTLPRYDIVACHDHSPELGWPEADGREASASGPPTDGDQRLVAFCHRTAAAIYESLVEGSHGAAADAVMASYYEMAESRGPDDLCLTLLERMAEELSARLSPAEQADVLSDAAGAVGPRSEATDPVAAALSDLRGCGLVGEFTSSGWSVDDDGHRSVEFRLSEYALSPRDNHLPVLPIVVDLFRRGLERPPTETWVVHTEGGWEFTLVFARDGEPDGLTNAPIRPTPSA